MLDMAPPAAVQPESEPAKRSSLPRVETGGYVAAGYERVREQFLREFEPGGQEDRAQVCAYVHGVKVVDLWASRVASRPSRWGRQPHEEEYGPSSLQNIFSSTKALTSLVIAMLVERGHLSYDLRIADIWPEFGCNGKETTTLAMVMRHEAGLSAFDGPIDVKALTTEAIRSGDVGNFIASQRARHPPGARRVYHALTRGWILNEVVRRADPAGRTIGEFLLEEVSSPLSLESELRIGLPEELHGRVAPLHDRSGWWFAKQVFLPRVLGGGRVVGLETRHRIGIALAAILAIAAAPIMVVAAMVVAFQSGALTLDGNEINSIWELFNSAETRKCEIPSANGHASARALAKVAATIAAGGISPDGIRLLSQEGVEAAHASPVRKKMVGLSFTFSNAGWCIWGERRLGYIGWMGLGGSVMQWHREKRIGFGYANNSMQLLPMNLVAYRLQKRVLECARNQS